MSNPVIQNMYLKIFEAIHGYGLAGVKRTKSPGNLSVRLMYISIRNKVQTSVTSKCHACLHFIPYRNIHKADAEVTRTLVLLTPVSRERVRVWVHWVMGTLGIWVRWVWVRVLVRYKYL